MSARNYRILSIGLAVVACTSCGANLVTEEDESDGWVVVDDEPGMSPDDLPHADDPFVDDPDTNPVDEPRRPSTDDSEPLTCTLEHSRFRETWWVDPSLTAFTPNGGLFVSVKDYGHEPHVLAVADGSEYFGSSVPGLRVTDRQWRFGGFDTYEPHPEIRDLRTGEVVATAAGDEYFALATVAPDGTQGAFLHCGLETARVDIVSLDGTAPRRSVDLGAHEYCWSSSPTSHGFVFSDEGRYLVAAVDSTSIQLIDTRTLETNSVVAHQLDEDPTYYGPVLAEVVVRPGGREVVTTGRDGVLRRWAIPSLEQVGEDLEVGVFHINENTYAPQYFVSPVAFTPDGRSMAYVGVDRNVHIVNAAGETIIETPAFEGEEEFARTPNVPVTMAFSNDGERFGIGYYWGPAVFGCPGTPRSMNEALVVEVPDRVSMVDSQAEIPVSFGDDDEFVAWKVVGEDGPISSASYADGTITVWLDPASAPYVLTVEASNGVSHGRATVQVSSTARP